jgi:Putative lumazine-binding
MRLRALAAFVFLVISMPAYATDRDERREVLATVQRLFDALAARDQAAVMAEVLPEGRITSHRVRDGNLTLRTTGWSEWAASLSGVQETLEERMHDPKVRIRGSMASVWTEYSFRRGGAFSHCGIDLVDLAKVDGRWRILNLSYTAETEGCRRR